MSAVTAGLVEAQQTKNLVDGELLETGGPQRALGDLGDFAGKLPTEYVDLASAHTSLTRLWWIRNALEHFAQSIRFRIVHDGVVKLRLTESPWRNKKGNPAFPGYAVPWSPTGSGADFSLWGLENSKMNCPVFDLPAGAPAIGGSCPGATRGQTITARAGATVDGKPDGKPVELQRAICNRCYATTGNFQYTNNQFAELLRYWWLTSMLASGRREELVDTLVLSIQQLRFAHNQYGILPIRLHSAGDFFSPAYAAVWCDVADALHDMGGNAARVRFWAPTRTWVSPNYAKFWKERLPRLHSVQDGAPPNLMVRPSAFHFDDPAPGPLARGNAAGSCSLRVSDDKGMERLETADGKKTWTERSFFPPRTEDRYDWRCPTYSVVEGAHSCSNATNPEGGRHCRACWVSPELRINYLMH